MLVVTGNDDAIVLQCLLVIFFSMVQDLSDAKMGWHTVLVQLYTVLEVLLGLTVLTKVRKLGGEMDCGAKVGLVQGKALLV